jgi:type VI secretion system protein VasG
VVGFDIRKLIEKFNDQATRLLDQAAGFCLTRTHYKITIEHFLLKAMDEDSGDILEILNFFKVDTGSIQKALLKTLEEFSDGNRSRPTFSPVFLEQIEQAWTLASINLGDTRIRTGHIMFALLNQSDYLSSQEYGRDLEKINLQELNNNFYKVVEKSNETTRVSAPKAGEAGEAEISEESYLGRYTSDFTGIAREGKTDPVLRRDREIREMIGILARRRKNNPILVGDPGVGKSAVVEGLAMRVVAGDVPNVLKGVTIRGLDMAMLQAGAGVKGEFEKRLKGVIDEVKASEVPIILFIDEAHTIIGAGGAAGGSDAANLLKPALARGELRTIASTTWSEYKKYFEKDAALARRFQLVKIDEPSEAHAIDIARGLRSKYEEAHGVKILDEALVDCVRLSNRYISGRQLPDKAVDLLDTACARIRINLSAKPGMLDDVERDLDALRTTVASLEAIATPSDEQAETLEKSKKEITELESRQSALETQWKAESAAVEDILKAQQEGNAEAEASAREKLSGVQKEERLVTPEVDAESICSVVTDWTGIPLSKMIADEAQTILSLEDRLKEHIKGQDWAMAIISQTIRAAKSGIKPKETPVGCCLLVGPSGVGKTETALTIADQLFGGERFVITVNMSEFQERHTVSRLIGSPPGYVGYGEGGFLTEALRKKPYSLVLIDETEKAHPDVLNLFYQVFDKGTLSDGEGREIDCKNALFLLTSNLATDTITKMTDTAVMPEPEELISAIRPELSAFFKPALLARMTILPYVTLPNEVLKEIVVLKLNKLKNRLFEAGRTELVYNEQVVDEIAGRCNEVETGARNIDQIIAQHIMPSISNELLGAMSKGIKPKEVLLGYENDNFAFSIKED